MDSSGRSDEFWDEGPGCGGAGHGFRGRGLHSWGTGHDRRGKGLNSWGTSRDFRAKGLAFKSNIAATELEWPAAKLNCQPSSSEMRTAFLRVADLRRAGCRPSSVAKV